MKHVRIGAGPAPYELISYVLCKDVYHCRPSELVQERVVDVMPHLTVHNKLKKWANRAS